MKKLIITLYLLFEFLTTIPYLSRACTCESPQVETIYGKVRGIIRTSRENRPFYAYRGIPFAKPPVGDLRFKAPQPPEPWNDILDATRDGPMCIQKNYLFHERPKVEGQEDCLYLNIYTPNTCTRKSQVLLPVMVNIHFGAFLAGTGNSDYMGPDYFMDKDVVLVTFNYRLGVFGLLSTNDDASPGNWAFKDQVAALQWVQDNIEAFGGDKAAVTIFGESAGAGSVHYHLLSPTTVGLFHKAISQSGSTLSLWAKPNNILQAEVARQQAQLVNCNVIDDSEAMVSCLRNVDAVTLAESSDLFKYFFSEPLTVFGPVTERKSVKNPTPYITEEPVGIIQSGQFQKVPWILGVVQDEGILRVSPFLRNRKIWKQLNESFSQYGPIIFGLDLSTPEEEVPSTWNKITDYFLNESFVDDTNPEKIQGFIDMFGDRAFKYGSYQSALLHAWKGHGNIWFYNFNYRGEYSYEQHFAGTDENINFPWGVCHADDLLYLFPSPRLFRPLSSPNDIQMSTLLVQMWTDFAIKGDPSPINKNTLFKWNTIGSLEGREKVTNSDLHYLNIAGEDSAIRFEIRNDFITERMHFWESLPLAENIEGIE